MALFLSGRQLPAHCALTRQGEERGRERERKRAFCCLSSCPCVCLSVPSRSVVSSSFSTPRTVAHQAPLSLGFSRQEHWSGLPCPPPGVFLTQGSHLHPWPLLHWQLDSLATEPRGKGIEIRSDQSSILRSPFNLNSFLTVARLGG